MALAKIVHISTVHGPFDVRIFQRECLALRAGGYDVVEVIPHDRAERVSDIDIDPLPRYRGRIRRMLLSPWRAYLRAVRHRATVYHFHDPELLPVGLMLKLRGNTVVYDSHEDLAGDILHKEWIPSIARPLVSRVVGGLESVIVRRLSGVVTAHENMTRRFSRVNAKVVTLENLPVTGEFPDHIANRIERFKSGVVAAFGGIDRDRVIAEIVTAMGMVSSGVRIIVGGDCASCDLARKVEALPGWSRVEYVGRVGRERMFALLGQAAAALVLYARGPNTQDVRSNRLFETLAMGLPVITPDFPEWRAFIADHGCGIAVNPHSPEQIAGAIDYICGHPEEATAMGLRGRRLFLDRLNWETQRPKLLGFYRSLVQPTSPSEQRAAA